MSLIRPDKAQQRLPMATIESTEKTALQLVPRELNCLTKDTVPPLSPPIARTAIHPQAFALSNQKTKKSSKSLADLPPELAERILALLHPTAATRLRRLSHAFRTLLSSLQFVRQNLRRNIPPHLKSRTHITWPDAWDALFLAAHSATALQSVYAGEWWRDVRRVECAHRFLTPRVGIPRTLGLLKALTHLDLSACRLVGGFPAEMGEMEALESLVMARNCLEGALPVELGRCTGLRVINVSSNKLSGAIPVEVLLGCKQLEVLNLASNRIEGEIPCQVGTLTNLKELHLAANQLVGKVPDSLSCCSNLEYLYLHSNGLDCSDIAHVLGGLGRLVARSF
ncbi:hypothetical protein BC830DRAFT_1094952 [Chytriomyces sp. MP71]|nr:hypothetical protein BC830DRAFT_1094952 [Chytriomyces sp. MP71]